MLGIIVGIGAIIVTFSVGSGAQKKVAKQILSMGENAVFIIPGNVFERGAIRPGDTKIKEKDLCALTQQVSAIKHITRGFDGLENIEYHRIKIKERVFGVEPHFLSLISKKKLTCGSFFTNYDMRDRSAVAVIGHNLAEKFFGKEYPLNKTIRINKKPFTIIGVLEKAEVFFGTNDQNNYVYTPFTVAHKHFSKGLHSAQDLGFIALSLDKHCSHDTTMRAIRRTLRYSRRIKPGEADDFTIFDQKAIGDSAESAAAVIKLFGLIAASISLLVGGIGVMNIMLVSVQERTREIGVRLALGATPIMIQIQFICEAVIVSFLGGIFGILFGLLLTFLLSFATNIPSQFSGEVIIASACITVLIGIFFGYYPAKRASLLNPVDALLDRG
jgi:putative ABC transport system permease protein